jgi:hypothetical protein
MGDPYGKLYGEAHGGQETDPYGSLYVAPVELPASTEATKRMGQFREEPPDPTLTDPGLLDTVMNKLHEGVSLGQSNKLTAALGAGALKFAHPDTNFGEAYRNLSRVQERESKAERQFHPVPSFLARSAGELPYYLALPETATGQIAGSSAIAATNAAGESPNVLGSEGTNARGAADVAKGAAWGAAGGAVGRYLSNGAPERLGKMADHWALRGSGGNTPSRMEKLRGAFPTEAPAGDLADALYGEKILRPWQSGEKVAKSYGEAFSRMGQRLGGLRQQAAESGFGVRISDVERLMEEEGGHLFPYNDQARAMRDNVVELLKQHAYAHRVQRPFSEVAQLAREGNQQVLGDLTAMKTPFESVTLPELQEALVGSGIQKGASDAYAAVRGNAMHSANEQEGNYMAVHRGLRRAEDENLAKSGVAGPDGARDLRRTMAVTKTAERVAGKAASQEHGKDPLGMFGWLTLGGAHLGGHGAEGTGAAAAIALARRFYGNELNTTAGYVANKLQNAMGSDSGRLLLRTAPSQAAPAVGPQVYDKLTRPVQLQPLPEQAQQSVQKMDEAQLKRAMEIEAAKRKLQEDAARSNTGDTDEELQ